MYLIYVIENKCSCFPLKKTCGPACQPASVSGRKDIYVYSLRQSVSCWVNITFVMAKNVEGSVFSSFPSLAGRPSLEVL